MALDGNRPTETTDNLSRNSKPHNASFNQVI